MEKITNDDKWEVLKSMYNEFGLVRQHLHSFNEFVDLKLNDIVQEQCGFVGISQYSVIT